MVALPPPPQGKQRQVSGGAQAQMWDRRGGYPMPTATSGRDLYHMGHMTVVLTPEDVEKEDLSGFSPGETLLKFLEFFGRKFDAGRLGISVRRGALGNPYLLSKSVDPRTGMAVMDAHVVIEDPLDSGQNIARSCFGFPQVQWLFAQCLSILETRGMETTDFDPDADLLHMLLYF
ncbi:unnamed protein product [Choristocarpus tenellus]